MAGLQQHWTAEMGGLEGLRKGVGMGRRGGAHGRGENDDKKNKKRLM